MKGKPKIKPLTFEEAFKPQLDKSQPLSEAKIKRDCSICFLSQESFQPNEVAVFVEIPVGLLEMIPNFEPKIPDGITHYLAAVKQEALKKQDWKYILPPDSDIPMAVIG